MESILTQQALSVNRAHLPCPLTFNPADHYVHVMAVTPGKELECRQRVKEVQKKNLIKENVEPTIIYF